jgi:hypothetical protein
MGTKKVKDDWTGCGTKVILGIHGDSKSLGFDADKKGSVTVPSFTFHKRITSTKVSYFQKLL